MDRSTVHAWEKVRSKTLRIPTGINLNISLLPQKTSFTLSFRRTFREIPRNGIILLLGIGPGPETFSERYAY
jgi:hypothetical protein